MTTKLLGSFVWIGVLFLAVPGWVVAVDCNGNLAEDLGDIGSGFSEDCNLNGVPDECEGPTLAFGSSVTRRRLRT